MTQSSPGFVRNWMLLLVAMAGCAFTLGGCERPFIARDIYFDNSADRDTEVTQVVLVALSQDEYQSVGKSDKPSTERESEFESKVAGAWGPRARVVRFTGPSDTHVVLSKGDPLWKAFRAAKDAKGNPAEWCALIIVAKDWKEGDRWSTAYRAAPADEIPDDRPAVTFKWTLEGPGGAGAPVCLSKQDPAGQ